MVRRRLLLSIFAQALATITGIIMWFGVARSAPEHRRIRDDEVDRSHADRIRIPVVVAGCSGRSPPRVGRAGVRVEPALSPRARLAVGEPEPRHANPLGHARTLH